MSVSEDDRPARKKAGMLQVAKAVFWSFFGVRKSRDHDRDSVSITPVQVVVAGIIGAAVLVFFLVMLVHFVTS